MFKNTMKTFVLLAGLAGLLLFIGSFFGSTGLFLALVASLAIVGFSYWFSDKLAVKSARAVEISEADNPQLYGMVRDLAAKADLPMPRVYISPNEQPNAFATGRSPSHAAVAVTQGLLQTMHRDEVNAVLAHEMSHIKHRDILIGSVAAAVGTAITYLAYFGVFFGGGRRGRGGSPIASLAILFLAPMAAGLIQMAVSRSREFEADRGAAELVGSGESLARALERLDASSKRVPMDVNPAQASAYIVNPLAGKKANFANLFTTHPPVEERIRRLRQTDSIIS